MFKNDVKKNSKKNEAGFMTAEFLFAFTMVLACGVLIFAFTFSLMTIEVAQYIVWSSARSYAVGHKDETASINAGKSKYKNLIAMFPLLTGSGNDSPWFKMTEATSVLVGDISTYMDGPVDKDNLAKGGSSPQEVRHPWTGVQADIDLILFKGIKIPFLGPIASDPSAFKFPVRAVLLRHPSQKECLTFFEKKFTEGIQKFDAVNEAELKSLGDSSAFAPMEDNGC